MGIPANALNCVRIRYEDVPETVVGRFDFIVTPLGPKMIEFNAENPYFFWESHKISGEVVRDLGFDDPNNGCEEALRAAVIAAITACRRDGRIVVSGYQGAIEDRATARYAADVLRSGLGDIVEFSPLDDLKVIPNGLYDKRGRIDVLYRFYPLQHFAADPGGTEFFDLIARDRLRILNPPCALLLENKCVQVLIWGLYERGAYFDDQERKIIERVFLPSYAELPNDAFDYVRKPVFGCDGNSITLIRRNAPSEESVTHDFENQPKIFQRHVELPRVPYSHPRFGPTEGRAITTCFLAGGVPGAIGMRVGGEITDGSAHFLPLAYAS